MFLELQALWHFTWKEPFTLFFGRYVAPEYANTGLLNERSDVYSFGVLLLESVTGRDPVDYGRPANEVNICCHIMLAETTHTGDHLFHRKAASTYYGRQYISVFRSMGILHLCLVSLVASVLF